MLENVSFDDVKKYVRMNITGACIKAVIFVPEFKGKQLCVLGPDKDLKDAKSANADPKTSEQCLGLADFVDSGAEVVCMAQLTCIVVVELTRSCGSRKSAKSIGVYTVVCE